MKYLLSILILVLTTTIFGQNENEKIKGIWGGCNKEYGYHEMVVTDSLTYRRSSNVFGRSFPLPYKFINNNLILLYPENETDTIFFKELEKNMIVIGFEDKERDTLYLLNKESPYSNPNIYCEMELTPSQYTNFLSAKFRERVIKNEHKCISLFGLESRYNATNYTVDFSELMNDLKNDPDFQLPEDFKNVWTDKIEFEIISKTNEYFKPILVDFKTNEKNGLSLVIVDFFGRCYDDVMIDFEIKDEVNVNCNISQTNMSCDESCILRIHFIVDTVNYTLKNITLNDINR